MIELLRVAPPLLAALAAIAFTLRIVIRHVVRRWRAGRIGDLVWYEINREVRAAGPGRPRYTADDFGPIYAFIASLRASAPYITRGVGSVVWLRHPDQTLRLYVGVSERHVGDGAAVRLLASALGGKAEQLAVAPPVPTGGLVVAHRSRTTATAARSEVESSGSVASALSTTMEQLGSESTAALIVTFDMMRNSETKRLESNIAEEALLRGGQSANFSPLTREARIMVDRAARVSLGVTNSTGSTQISEQILTAGVNGISTFGWQTSATAPGAAHARTSLLALGGAAALTVLCGIIGLTPVWGVVAIALLLAAAGGVLLARPELLIARWYRERAAAGEIVVPPFVYSSPRYHIRGNMRARRSEGNDDRTVIGNKVAPPSCKQVLTLHGAAAFELLSFPSRLAVDVSSSDTLSRGIPNAMVANPNPIYIGESGTGQHLSLDLSKIQYSLYTAGAPSSGKSNFLQVIYAGIVRHALDRTNGLLATPFWGETKGEGAYEAWTAARHHPDAIMVDVHNPRVYKRTNYRLALEGQRLSEGATVAEVVANVTKLVSGFQAAYGDGIKSASRELLESSLRIAMLLTPKEIEYLELDQLVVAEKPNVVELAFHILGGDARVQCQERLLRLNDQLEEYGEREIVLNQTIGQISRFLKKETRSKLLEALSSPLNKLAEMRNAKAMWEPTRRRQDAYMGHIVERFAPVVVNMGSYYDPETQNYKQTIERATSQRLLRAFNYLLWDYVKTHCNGWERAGKRIPMFFDEVADVATSVKSDDVPNTLDEGLKEGRSRGAAYFIGCQSPAQMPENVRVQALGTRSKFWFTLQGESDLAMAVGDLSSGERDNLPFTPSNIRGLKNGTAVGVMVAGDTVTPPFTLAVPKADEWSAILFASPSIEHAVADYAELKARQKAELQRAAATRLEPVAG